MMAVAYIISALIIIVLNISAVPGVFALIIGDAFTPMAGFGAAIGWGVKRGIYSNEAGEGTRPYTFDPKALGIKNAEFWEKRLEKWRRPYSMFARTQ